MTTLTWSSSGSCDHINLVSLVLNPTTGLIRENRDAQRKATRGHGRKTRDAWGPPGAGRHRRGPLLEPVGGTRPCRHLGLGLWLREPGRTPLLWGGLPQPQLLGRFQHPFGRMVSWNGCRAFRGQPAWSRARRRRGTLGAWQVWGSSTCLGFVVGKLSQTREAGCGDGDDGVGGLGCPPTPAPHARPCPCWFLLVPPRAPGFTQPRI